MKRLTHRLATRGELPEPMSAIVERLLAEECERHGEPEVALTEIARHPPATRRNDGPIFSAHLTF